MRFRLIGIFVIAIGAGAAVGQSRMPIGKVKIAAASSKKPCVVALKANGKGSPQPIKDGAVVRYGDVLSVSGSVTVTVEQFNGEKIPCKSPGSYRLKRVSSQTELIAEDDLTKHTVEMARPRGEGVFGRIESGPCPSRLLEIILDGPKDCRFTIDGVEKVFRFSSRGADGAFSNPEASAWLAGQEDDFGQRLVTVAWKESGKELDAKFQLPSKSQDGDLVAELAKLDAVTDGYARALRRASWFAGYQLPFHAALELRRLDAACPDKRIEHLAEAYLKAASGND